MKTRTTAIIIFALLLVSFSLGQGHSPTTTMPAKPISVAELNARGISGKLGVRLGQIVTINGAMVDGHSLGWKDAEGRRYIRVGRVADRLLAPPALVEVRDHPFAKHALKLPATGGSVVLTGWETGAYDGIVDGEFDYLSPYANVGYGFRTWFVAVRAEAGR